MLILVGIYMLYNRLDSMYRRCVSIQTSWKRRLLCGQFLLMHCELNRVAIFVEEFVVILNILYFCSSLGIRCPNEK